MNLVGATRFPAAWLDLREPADAAARAVALLDPLRDHLAARLEPGPSQIWDLGSGTGALTRWLAPRLPYAQQWLLHDQDEDLLSYAAERGALVAADGSPVTVEHHQRDVTSISAADLAGVSLLTASALLDLLTAAEIERLAAAGVEADVAVWLSLSVTGEVTLVPADPLDDEIRVAFNEHQCRTVNGRRLLGPDAPVVAAEAFARRGAQIHRHASPWRLGADHPALLARWLQGWVAAACEQRPQLTTVADDYLRRRLAACVDGTLRAVVGHLDLLALPAREAG